MRTAKPVLDEYFLYREYEVLLTPELYAELDAISRERVGRPVLVRDRLQEMNGNFGQVGGGFGGEVILDPVNSHALREHSVIEIANTICPNIWGNASRPEMDWSAVPIDQAYRFVLEHEIAHCGQNTMYPLFHMEVMHDRKLMADYRKALEVDADRKAWNYLYPGEPVPRRRGAGSKRDSDRLLKRWDKAINPIRTWKVKTITTDLLQYMPLEHYRRGIPFVDSKTRRPRSRNAFAIALGLRNYSPEATQSHLQIVEKVAA